MDSEKEIVEKYSTDNKLNCNARCPKCPSLVLCKNDARIHEEKFALPGFATTDPETVFNFWWRVDDMFDFANIGFRKFSNILKLIYVLLNLKRFLNEKLSLQFFGKAHFL